MKRVRVDFSGDKADDVLLEVRLPARAFQVIEDYVGMRLGLMPRSLQEYVAMALRDAADKCSEQARRERWVWSHGRPLFRGRRAFPRGRR